MFEATAAAPVRTAVNTGLARIGMLGNYPPRRCGIATFTADVHAAIAGADPAAAWSVVAMNDPGAAHEYGDAVTSAVRQDSIQDYRAAAAQLNREGVAVVSIQHEFGIFGGPAGANLGVFLDELRCPVVTTLHTILDRPTPEQRAAMEMIIARSARLVVMSQRGADILQRVFNVPARKIEVIPHGAPDPLKANPGDLKAKFGLGGKEVALTFGLLSPGKGLESAIRALPQVVKRRPNFTYVILGATHPHLRALQGEQYRESLASLAAELGVAEHVRFVNAYVDDKLLIEYLTAADIYVTPYLNKTQITSGTLAYAVALGKPVVSTPYWHAEDLLGDGGGILTPFDDSHALGEALISLLEDDALRQRISAEAFRRGRETTWEKVGKRYLDVLKVAAEQPRAIAEPRRAARAPAGLPLRALRRMSDDCGMFQHAKFSIPDRRHGYCLDDNARALMLTQRLVAANIADETTDHLAAIYASFVDYAWDDDAQVFRNFMGYDRRWLERVGSEDSAGRGLWAIGESAQKTRDPDLRRWALDLGGRASVIADRAMTLRAGAFCILGLAPLARMGEGRAADRVRKLADQIASAFERESTPDWEWFESTLAYDNPRLPEALLVAADLLDDTRYRAIALRALSWLCDAQTSDAGVFRPVGNQSFGRVREAPKQFDQQPLESIAAIDACWAAFDATGDARWSVEAERAFAWYLGENDLGVMLARPESGGCFDGLSASEPNRNQGAESILSYLTALCAMRERGKAPALVA